MPWTIEYTETALTQLRKLDKRTARRIVASSMNAKQLLTHFDRLADAPDAIPRLRRFILDLAVRGKLVEQDQNEGTGSSLLTEIERGQAAHVSSRRLKKTHKLEGLSFSDVPFQVPENWALVRLGQTLDLVNGRAFKPSDWTQTGLPIVRIQNLNNPFAAFNHYDGEVKEKFLIDSGDFLISWSGTPGTSFGAHIWMGGPAVLNQHIFKAILIGNVFEPHFLKLAINARLFELIEQAHGGVGLQHITKPKLEAVVLTLPPLAEQHHIVAKVDELMALCDRLETARKEREATRDRLAAASLARLNAPDLDSAVFQNHAAFVLNNLTPLTTRPDQIKALRQSILNLAVRGKLVEQDPTDGEGGELLTLLKNTRIEWETAGRIRKQKGDRPVGEEERYLDTPANWVWARLSEIGQTQTGTTPSSSNADLFGDYIPFIKPADLDGSEINYNGPGLSEEGIRHSRLTPANSALMVCIGATLGKVNKTTRPICFNQQINSLAPYLKDITAYILLALRSSDFQALAWSKAGTGTLPIISKGKWEVLPVPLPPLAEQHRIVAKIDELMAVCDRLEASLAAGEETRGRLVEAVLYEALHR